MKQSPTDKKIQELMKPGRLTLDGMLGQDHRALSEIVDADQSAVNGLGVTHDDIAGRLDALTRAGLAGLGTEIVVEDAYEVCVCETRGRLPCPFGDRALVPKSITHLRSIETGEEMHWTRLGIHMIRAHGFYEGHGAHFHVDPARAVRILKIPPRCPL